MSKEGDFKPTIAAFLCNWCSYAAADMAGISRFQYPTNVRIMRVPCTGEIDITHVLRAFENGIDGVFISGCLKEQCHYIDGNYKAEAMVKFARKLLEKIGFDHERLEMHFISAGMGPRFAEAITEFTEKITKIGPNEIKAEPSKFMEGNKRMFLVSLIKNLTILPPEKIDLVIDDLDGFGEAALDREKCIGCGSCANICDTWATKATDGEGIRRLTFTQGLCVACKKCEEQCKEEAIKVSRVFDLNKIMAMEEVIMNELELELCSICQAVVAPRKQLEKDNAEKPVLCPGCKEMKKGEKIYKITMLDR